MTQQEPNNLMNVSSYRYSGLVHKKTLGITPAADKKGCVVNMKKSKYANRPARNNVRLTFKAGPRRSLKKLRNLLTNNKYRKDLTQVRILLLQRFEFIETCYSLCLCLKNYDEYLFCYQPRSQKKVAVENLFRTDG